MIRVCSIDDVPRGEGRAVTVAGRRLAIFHGDGAWYALDAACPHLGGPLADGIVASQTVICPLHERRFDLVTGEQVGGGACAQAHTVELRDDGVWVRLAAPRALAA